MSSKAYEGQFVLEAAKLPKHLRCGPTAIAIHTRLGFVQSSMGHKKVLVSLVHDNELPPSPPEGQRISCDQLAEVLFGDGVKVSGKIRGEVSGGFRYKLNLGGSSTDIYLQGLQVQGMEVNCWGIAMTEKNLANLFQHFQLVFPAAAAALLKPCVKTLVGLPDITKLLLDIQAFQTAMTVEGVLSLIHSNNVAVTESADTAYDGTDDSDVEEGELRDDWMPPRDSDRKKSPRDLVVAVSKTDTAEDEDSDLDDEQEPENEEELEGLKLEGLQPPRRLLPPTEFPDRKAVVQSMKDEDCPREMLLEATTNMDDMLYLILGAHTERWTLDKKVKEFGQQPYGNSPLKNLVTQINQWRNHLSHNTKKRAPNLESMKTNKVTLVFCYEQAVAHLDTIYKSNQTIERLESDYRSARESLSSDNSANKKKLHEVTSQRRSSGRNGVASTPKRRQSRDHVENYRSSLHHAAPAAHADHGYYGPTHDARRGSSGSRGNYSSPHHSAHDYPCSGSPYDTHRRSSGPSPGDGNGTHSPSRHRGGGKRNLGGSEGKLRNKRSKYSYVYDKGFGKTIQRIVSIEMPVHNTNSASLSD